MPMSSDRDQNCPNETGRPLLGRALVDWIVNSVDFPLAEAHSINSASWSDDASRRFNRFNLDAETGGIGSFLENPWVTPEGPLLDIACTSGHNLSLFSRRGIQPLYGIDISLPFVELAKKRVPGAFVHRADMVALPFRTGYFKTVVARGIFHNTTTQGFLKAMTEVHRVLRDDGVLFLRRRYRPFSFDRLTHYALYTYLEFDGARPETGGLRPTFVRNFVPPPQIKSLIESVGFKLIGDPPMRVVEQINNEGKWRYSIECICTKNAPSAG